MLDKNGDISKVLGPCPQNLLSARFTAKWLLVDRASCRRTWFGILASVFVLFRDWLARKTRKRKQRFARNDKPLLCLIQSAAMKREKERLEIFFKSVFFFYFRRPTRSSGHHPRDRIPINIFCISQLYPSCTYFWPAVLRFASLSL